LAAIVADRNRPRKHVERAGIVLASADRHPAQQVAQRIGVSRPTVWRWQQRFAESGVEGLLRDKTRKPGKAPLAAEITAQLVALTCTEPPHQATHWTGRAMAKTIGISVGSVQRIIRFLNAVERQVSAGELIHVVLDNYATHKHPKSLPSRRRGYWPGWRVIRVGPSTSPRPRPPGSTPSRTSSPR